MNERLESDRLLTRQTSDFSPLQRQVIDLIYETQEKPPRSDDEKIEVLRKYMGG